MRDFIVLGSIFLFMTALFYLYWPTYATKEEVFFPELGLLVFLFSQLFYLGAAVIARRSDKEEKGLLLGLLNMGFGLLYYGSFFLNELVRILRADPTVPGFIPLTANVLGFKLEYLNLTFLVGLLIIIINLGGITKVDDYLAERFQILKEQHVRSEIFLGVLLTVLITNVIGMSLFALDVFLQLSLPFVSVLLVTGILSALLLSVLLVAMINAGVMGIDPKKLNVRRDSLIAAMTTLVLNLVGYELIFFTFGSNIPEGEPFYWLTREVIVNSLFTGMIYLQVALGITLIYKILKFANFAQAELVTFGAYMGFILGFLGVSLDFWSVFDVLGVAFRWIPILLLLATFAFILTAIFGLIMDRVFFYPLRKHDAPPVALMIASFGIGLAFREIFRSTFSANLLLVNSYFVEINLNSNLLRLFVILVALIVVWFFNLVLYRSKTGKIMRAVADNPDLASISGIKSERVIFLVWIIAAGFAGAAGVFFASYPVGTRVVGPELGFGLLLAGFAAAILGGIGSFEGALIASIILGFTESIGIFFLTQLNELNIQFDIPVVVVSASGALIEGTLINIGSVLLVLLIVVAIVVAYLVYKLIAERVDSKWLANSRMKLGLQILLGIFAGVLVYVGAFILPFLQVDAIHAQFAFGTGYKLALSFSVLIAVLLVRPQGLLGEKETGER